MEQLLKWAEKGDEPIRSYATGLLAGAMDLQDVASNFKDKNSHLVSFRITLYKNDMKLTKISISGLFS